MNISFYNGVSGLIAYQQEMDVLSHNMANVNTAGYKGSRVSFEDLLYTEMDTNGEQKHLTGHGVRAASVDVINTQGMVRWTDNLLDLAILGEGFFAVEREDGAIEYTRSGAFDISLEGKNGYLVTRDGGYILTDKGKRIKLGYEDSESKVFDLTDLAEKVGVYLFPNPFGLEQTDGSCFRETDLSGEAYTIRRGRSDDLPYEVIQTALESSNIQLTDQMISLIVTQRAYQMNSKMVQTSDEIEEIVNNLR